MAEDNFKMLEEWSAVDSELQWEWNEDGDQRRRHTFS